MSGSIDSENHLVLDRVYTTRAAKPAGHYSQGCSDGRTLYVSGQLSVDPDGTPRPDLDFEQQVRTALRNVIAIVEDGGSRIELILKINAYIVGVENWTIFNRVYHDVFGEWRPARSVVPVPALHFGSLIELDAVAAIPA
ncbi:RidA family protein [Beijerinckia sp. L45]|uniref:RidA family protein n=1 Tax=Beijerinckia sp. L45 TaxID=1641855 RepID=UPI00131BFA38|nr:RidA family protein [Beijerinckia sp. L45]